VLSSKVGRFLVLFVAGALSLPAAVVFSDTFASANGGIPGTNVTTLPNWNVTRGAVDVIGSGTGTLFDIYPGNNLYLDLDPSSLAQQVARIETNIEFVLTPGTWVLEFDLGGNQAGGSRSADNSLTVSLGGFSELITRTNVPFPNTPSNTLEHVVRNIVISSTTNGRIVFDASGPVDLFGLIIDNVTLTSPTTDIPEPSTLAPAALALLAAGLLRRRRS
jgi:MYXO-CTERM domain-containing protein